MSSLKFVNGTEKEDLIQLISQCPEALLEQFAKLTAYYLGYLSTSNIASVQEKARFINECFNTVSLLNKIIAITVDGDSMKGSVNVDPKSKEILNRAIAYYNMHIATSTQFVKDEVKEEATVSNEDTAENNSKEEERIDDKMKKSSDEKETKKNSTKKKSTSAAVEKKTTTRKKKEPEAEAPVVEEEKSVKKSTRKKKVEEQPVEVKEEKKKTPSSKKTSSSSTKKSATSKKIKETVEKMEKPVRKEHHVHGEDLTVDQIMQKELTNWGISPEKFGYKVYASIPKVCSSSKLELKDVVLELSKYHNRSVATVMSGLSAIARNGNFENSEFFKLLKSIRKERSITVSDIVKEALDFVGAEDD